MGHTIEFLEKDKGIQIMIPEGYIAIKKDDYFLLEPRSSVEASK